MDNLTLFIDLVNNLSAEVTTNTIENIYRKLDTITPEQFLKIKNYNANLLQAENIKIENIKNMIVNDVKNKLEQYVSQL